MLVALALLLALPAIAAAHAGLRQSQPADGEVVPSSPAALVLTFSQPVESALADVRVFNANAEAIATGAPQSQSPPVVRVTIDEPLPNGTYTVSWRVLSVDGHPIDGAFVFHVGAPGERAEGVVDQVGPGERPGLERLDSAARMLHLALVVLLLGALMVTVGIFARIDTETARQLWYVVAGLGFALSIVAAATVVIQAALVTGSGLADATTGSVLSTVLETRLGKVRLVELILAEIIAVGAVWASSPGARWLPMVLVALGAVLAITPGLSGHAGAVGPLAVIADAGHVIAASGWVGGLAAVLAGLRLAGPRARDLAPQVWPRYSSLALISVGVLIGSGTIGSFVHVDAFSQLWETSYGRLLVAKMAIALGLIGFGVWNRAAVRRLGDEQGAERGLRRLRRSVGVELAVMAGAIVVTSFLIATPPSNSAAAAPAPTQAAASATAGDVGVRVVADPGRAGTNTIVVTLTRGQAMVIGAEVAVTLRPSERDLGRLRRDATETQPGRYVADAQFATPGDWVVDVDIRSSGSDLLSTTVTLPIRDASG